MCDLRLYERDSKDRGLSLLALLLFSWSDEIHRVIVYYVIELELFINNRYLLLEKVNLAHSRTNGVQPLYFLIQVLNVLWAMRQ